MRKFLHHRAGRSLSPAPRFSFVRRLGLATSLLALTVTACTHGKSPSPKRAEGSVEGAKVNTSLSKVGLDSEIMDTSVSPCEDFYRYACGNWLDSTEIPSDRSRWSRGFSVVAERNEALLREILESAVARKAQPDAEKDEVLDSIGTFYSACMNEAAATEAGLSPIAPLLQLTQEVRTREELLNTLVQLHQVGVWPLFDISAAQDFKNTTQVVAYLDQAGLGLPDRDYYLNDDERSQAIREAYLGHVQRMLVLGGLKDEKAKQAAQEIFELEKQLAQNSKSRVERRDPYAIYNKRSVAELGEIAPGFDWPAYLNAMGLSVDELVLTSVEFFQGLDKILAKISSDTLQNYLRWNVLQSFAPSLSQPFVDESFAMTQVLTGQPELLPRWKRCIASTDQWLGENLAQPWLEQRFGPESKASTEQMVFAISQAFGENLDTLPWMDAKTRERAHAKREAMAYQIGYPQRWRSYDFSLSEVSHAANVLAARAFEQRRDLAKVGKPVDRSEWYMSPPTVNAYYSPLMNQMVFPAGILQPPFYNPKASLAVNMGAMGMVVGHELTHGFDDQGSHFAADGNLVDWWEPEVSERFAERTQCVARQYSGYEALPALNLNGELTLGENIADIGGVKLAFQAYRKLRDGAGERFVADGFTEDQQFFLSMAQSWCTKYREEALRLMIQVDPHSPPQFRVNGSLANIPEFAEAFSCEEGSGMKPINRCEVW